MFFQNGYFQNSFGFTDFLGKNMKNTKNKFFQKK